MAAADPLILDTVSRMLAENCGPEVVEAAEDGTWPEPLWRLLEESGLTLAWVPEALGGAGAGLADGFGVARCAAAHAAPVPVAETLLAGWLLAEAGLGVPAGPLTIAPVEPGDSIARGPDGRLTGRCARVPFARQAGHAAVIATGPAGPAVALVALTPDQVSPGTNIAGEPRDGLRLDSVRPVAAASDVGAGIGEALRSMGAVMRAHQIAGALEAVLTQSLGYARERVQFGRPIAKFQAIQHSLAMLAGEAAAAAVAADAGVAAIARHGGADARAFTAVAAAKIRAGEAAGTGAAIAHQVHGAIGYTREYSLQQRSRRLWAWRDDFGPEAVWSAALGQRVAGAGADALWPSLTAM